jgi:hypothetical protein
MENILGFPKSHLGCSYLGTSDGAWMLILHDSIVSLCDAKMNNFLATCGSEIILREFKL